MKKAYKELAKLDQMPDPEPVDGGPTRAAVDWHELAKHAPNVDDDERSMPAVADRKILRRRGRVTVRRGFLRPPMSAEAVARMVELRAQGLGFGRIAKAIGCARITVSRYLSNFEEESRCDRLRDAEPRVQRPNRPSRVGIPRTVTRPGIMPGREAVHTGSSTTRP